MAGSELHLSIATCPSENFSIGRDLGWDRIIGPDVLGYHVNFSSSAFLEHDT